MQVIYAYTKDNAVEDGQQKMYMLGDRLQFADCVLGLEKPALLFVTDSLYMPAENGASPEDVERTFKDICKSELAKVRYTDSDTDMDGQIILNVTLPNAQEAYLVGCVEEFANEPRICFTLMAPQDY